MRRRALLVLGLVIALAALASLVVAIIPNDLERIPYGASREEVESIMGAPPNLPSLAVIDEDRVQKIVCRLASKRGHDPGSLRRPE